MNVVVVGIENLET